ncbi:DNA-methyltransferase [Vibrio campbellii]|nr:site-specific DNA-methyltransferase [Vibrio vulnificus]
MNNYKINNSDAVEYLRTLDDESVDLVITDPPYESLEKHRSKGTTTRLKVSKGSSNQWFDIFPNERFEELFTEVYRVLKKNSHFYLFCDQETMFVAKPIGEQVGFKFWKPIIWDKVKIGMGYHYRARYEMILFFEKGKRKLNNLGIPDIITSPRVHRGYPTEKPVDVSKVLIEQSTNENELVVDPFCGSGSVGIAALESNRNTLLNDISLDAIEVARSRASVIESAQELTDIQKNSTKQLSLL